MESSGSEVDLTRDLSSPNSMIAATNITGSTLIPEISKEKYITAYNSFIDWCKKQAMSSYSEEVLLTYFGELAKKFKPTTLWTQYSMLRITLSINNGVDVSKYLKLKAFLKRQSHGYRSKKSKIFTSDEINTFIKEAPDREHLFTKVALIMGIVGACRRDELYKMQINDFKDMGSAVLVEVPNSKTRIARKFVITGPLYEIFKKYVDLRPKNVNDSYFFLNYQKGKCTVQRVGINKFGNLGKQIATYLKLPNPGLYTGHCFRRSSATILLDSGENITSLKRNAGWKSTAVAEGFIEDSLINKHDIANQIMYSTEKPTTVASTSWTDHLKTTENNIPEKHTEETIVIKNEIVESELEQNLQPKLEPDDNSFTGDDPLDAESSRETAFTSTYGTTPMTVPPLIYTGHSTKRRVDDDVTQQKRRILDLEEQIKQRQLEEVTQRIINNKKLFEMDLQIKQKELEAKSFEVQYRRKMCEMESKKNEEN